MKRKPRPLNLTERPGLADRRVADDERLPAAIALGQRAQPLERGADQRKLGRVAGIGAQVERDPVGGRGLKRPHLAVHALPLGPALGDQRRVLVGAGHPQRGQIDVQPAGIDPEALDRPRREFPAHLLGVGREALQPAPEAVVVEQRRRDSEQLLDRGAGGPAGDVIERRGRAEPVGDQRQDQLADRELGAAACGRQAIDRLDEAELTGEVGDQQQRPDVAADTSERRVETGERRRRAGSVGPTP